MYLLHFSENAQGYLGVSEWAVARNLYSVAGNRRTMDAWMHTDRAWCISKDPSVSVKDRSGEYASLDSAEVALAVLQADTL